MEIFGRGKETKLAKMVPPLPSPPPLLLSDHYGTFPDVAVSAVIIL